MGLSYLPQLSHIKEILIASKSFNKYFLHQSQLLQKKILKFLKSSGICVVGGVFGRWSYLKHYYQYNKLWMC